MLVDTVVVVTGLICLVSHVASVVLFKYLLPDGAWRRHPQFLAHQVVALPLMVVCAWIGTKSWFFPTPEERLAASTVDGRVHEHTETGELLARIVVGAQVSRQPCHIVEQAASPPPHWPPPPPPPPPPQVFWDIPTTGLVPALYSRLMMFHHVFLTIIATVTLIPYVQYYNPFFAGVIEISAIPLVIVDVFHPTRYGDVAEQSPLLGKLNAVCRVSFAVLFLIIRGLYFPYVVLFQVLPDMAAVIRQGTELVPPLVCGSIAGLMMSLQLYWGSLILKQLKKMLAKAPDPRKEGYEAHGEMDDL